jgi:type I restriction enzyme M protein
LPRSTTVIRKRRKRSWALRRTRATLEARLAKTDALLKSVGGPLTEAQAEKLILKKLFDLADYTLQRYANAEKRKLIAANDNFWEKYSLSHRDIELKQTETLEILNGHLIALGYAR